MLKVEHLLAGVYDLEVTLVDGKQYRQAVTLGERTSMQVVVPQY
jgi:hypothetical protein